MKKNFKIFFLSLLCLFVLAGAYFLLMVRLSKNAMDMKDNYVSGYSQARATLLPSLFLNGQRFYIKMARVAGDTLLAYGDSGGGISIMTPNIIDKLHLRSKVRTALLKGLMPFKFIYFNDVVHDDDIPPPMPLRSILLRYPLSRVITPALVVPPLDDEMRSIIAVMPFDIFLGQNFFMGHSWTFDYPHRQVWVNTPIAPGEAGNAQVQRLGFKKNKYGDPVFGHGSFYIEVDGELIEVLLDTGATIVLSEKGKELFHTTDKTMGGSFIAASIFDKWRKKHPDWKCYEKADLQQDVIEVPMMTIGQYEAGPVLFARRKDEVWSQGMIATMDTVVRGAIGGSALQYFKVMADYYSGLIKFER